MKSAFAIAGAFALFCTLADATALIGSERGGALTGVLPFSFFWGFLPALLLAGPCLALLRPRTGPRALSLLTAVALAAVAGRWLDALMQSLLSGPGISQKSFVETARLVAHVVAYGGPFVLGLAAGPMLERWHRRQRPLPLRGGLALLTTGGAVVLAVIDARVQPFQYPDAHLLCWIGIFLALTKAFVLVRPPAPPGLSAHALTLAGLVFLAVPASLPPLTGPLREGPSESVARRAAWSETLWLKRVLLLVAPTDGEASTVTLDPEVAAALSRSPQLDPELLDRALPDRRRFNLLLLSIDAFRADRLRADYERDVTPNLQRLAKESVHFTQAWTPWPATLMGFSSIFRGRFPTGTDVFREFAAPGSVSEDERDPTLAGMLSAAGWRTEGVTGFWNPYFDPLERGFQTFNDYPKPGREMVAEEIVGFALAAADRADERPWMIWTHLYDPHDPYDPPGGSPFGDSPVDRYDGEILYTDRQAGRLIDGLRRRGLLDTTVVVVFGDHGEEFGERGQSATTHGSALNQLQIHVPLLVRIPGLPGRRIDQPVTLVDIAPTLLELVGAEHGAAFHGRSLLPYALKGPPPHASAMGWPSPSAYAELERPTLPGGRQRAARLGDFKLVLDLQSQSATGYDLAKDPQERNALPPDTSVLSNLRSILDSYRVLTRRMRRLDGDPNDRDKRWRRAAAATLRSRPSAPVDALRALDEAKKVRVLRELAQRPWPAGMAKSIRPLLDAPWSTQLRVLALRVLTSRTDAAPAAWFTKFVEDEDAAIRREALVALARRGDKTTLLRLREARSVDDHLALLRALAGYGDLPALQQALCLLTTGYRDAVLGHDLVRTIVQLRAPGHVELLVRLLGEAHDELGVHHLLEQAPLTEMPEVIQWSLWRLAQAQGHPPPTRGPASRWPQGTWRDLEKLTTALLSADDLTKKQALWTAEPRCWDLELAFALDDASADENLLGERGVPEALTPLAQPALSPGAADYLRLEETVSFVLDDRELRTFTIRNISVNDALPLGRFELIHAEAGALPLPRITLAAGEEFRGLALVGRGEPLKLLPRP